MTRHLKRFKNLLSRSCEHHYHFDSNIHGDWIHQFGGRSFWKCCQCGQTQVRPERVPPPWKAETCNTR